MLYRPIVATRTSKFVAIFFGFVVGLSLVWTLWAYPRVDLGVVVLMSVLAAAVVLALYVRDELTVPRLFLIFTNFGGIVCLYLVEMNVLFKRFGVVWTVISLVVLDVAFLSCVGILTRYTSQIERGGSQQTLGDET
jgi:hypothetical protein